MQRQKKKSYSGGRYPNIARYVRLYTRKAGLGLVVGVAATGCFWPWHVDGDMVGPDTAWRDTGAIPGDIGETGEVFYLALPDSGERNLQFEDPVWGQIDYNVDLVIVDQHVYAWLINNPEAAMAAIDVVLLSHAVTDFREYTSDGTIEQQIRQAIVDAAAGTPGSDTTPVREATLNIVHYTDENDIDGDIG